MLHGTGGDEDSLIPLGQHLDAAANILSPRGRVDEHGSNRFFRRLAEGVFDEDSIRSETAALASFVVEASETYGFDAPSVTAVGFSNGANIAASLMLLSPSTLAGAAMIRAMVPLVPAAPPDLNGKRVLILTGNFDPILPVANARRLAEMLREAGAEVDHRLLDAGHNLTKEDVEIAQSWLTSFP